MRPVIAEEAGNAPEHTQPRGVRIRDGLKILAVVEEDLSGREPGVRNEHPGNDAQPGTPWLKAQGSPVGEPPSADPHANMRRRLTCPTRNST